jgi:type II secretory pathway predicted ATPase ExeA
MFLDFYQLREQPFGVTPDPRYLYLSNTHREALASLVYGIETGRGFMALIGNPGMGKTTLLFHLLERCMGNARTVFLFQTLCDSRELLRYLLADLGLDAGDHDVVRMHAQLNELLLHEARLGKRVVLVIDEAQNLGDSVLEMVRLLSDFETHGAKLLQIILTGQPELADKLARPGLAQLRQRIAILSRLQPFNPAETNSYISHRLSIAGHKGHSLFTAEARALIAQHSQGIPRNINNLCFNALSLGYALNRKTIDASILQEVLTDLNVGALAPEQLQIQRHSTPAPLKAPLSRYQPVRNMASGRIAALAACVCSLFLLASSFSIGKLDLPEENDRQADPISIPTIVGQGLKGQTEVSSRPNTSQTRTVVVERQDTLRSICLRYLGRFDQETITNMFQLNPELVLYPNSVRIGDRIRLPGRSGPLKGESLVYGPGNERKP